MDHLSTNGNPGTLPYVVSDYAEEEKSELHVNLMTESNDRRPNRRLKGNIRKMGQERSALDWNRSCIAAAAGIMGDEKLLKHILATI